MFENPRRGRQARRSENSRFEIVFRTDNFRKFTWRWVALNILSALIRVLVYVEKQHGGSKATKTLNLIKSIFWFCGEDTKCLLYETLVRPKLEHASVVWDPHYLSGVYISWKIFKEQLLVFVQARAIIRGLRISFKCNFYDKRSRMGSPGFSLQTCLLMHNC